MHTLRTESLEFRMKVKDIPKFEKMNTRSINVFELTGTVSVSIHINTNYDQPQTDLLLYENHYGLMTKLHCLINKHSNMRHVFRRRLTTFSSQPVLIDHIDRCQKQQPTKIEFSWKENLTFEDHHMKIRSTKKVYAYLQCINQPQNNPSNPKVLFKQIPIVYLISPVLEITSNNRKNS